MSTKPFVFVLMPFGDAFRDTYLLGIKPACQDAGYYCERLDEQIFDETMLDRIYNQIAKADLVVADLTERNPNVFYEVGYAHALGKRVILLTRNSDDIPFDLKHHFHIVYSEGIAKLKALLHKRAKYYLSHPEASTLNPFDQFTLLVNGRLIDWSDKPLSIVLNPRFIGSQRNLELAVTVELAFHPAENSEYHPLEIDVRLITDPIFYRSGWEISSGSGQIYMSIPMPDGRTMHKALNGVRLENGDPDMVIFDLYPSSEKLPNSEYPATLRLISSGLRREQKIILIVNKAF